MIRAVVSDLDGTFWSGRAMVHELTLDAVEQLRAAGIGLLFATGRRYASALAGLGPLGLAGPAVLLSGSLGADLSTGVEWHRRAFAPDDAWRVLHGFRAEGLDPVVYVCSADVDTIVTTDCSTSDAHMQAMGHPDPGNPESAVEAGAVVAFGLCGLPLRWAPTTGRVAAAIRDVSSVWEGPDHVDGGWTIMVSPHRVSKVTATAMWCRTQGIAPSEVLAVGDGANDVDLLQWAGTAVAVRGGATEANGCDHVIPQPREGGWARILDLL